MRAILITAPAGGDNLNVTEAPAPTPGHGEVLIDVAYCGCNFADTMIAKGTYPHPKGYPLIGGLEVSGRIAEVGPDVRGFAVGDAVASSWRRPEASQINALLPQSGSSPFPTGWA